MNTLDYDNMNQLVKDFVDHLVNSEDFEIDQECTDEVARHIPGLMNKYGTLYAITKGDALKQEIQCKKMYATLALEARASGEKMTEAKIKEKVESNPDFIGEQDKLAQYRAHAIAGEIVWRSIQKKADLTIALIYKENTENKADRF